MISPLAVTALAALWVAALWRLWLSIRRRPYAWWRWTFTISVVGLACAGTAFVFEDQIGPAVGVPTLGPVLCHLCLTFSAGTFLGYLLSLLKDRPGQVLFIGVALTTLGTGAAQAITWLRAPVHQGDVADLGQVNGAADFLVASFAPMVIWALVTAGVSLALARRPAAMGDTSLRPGLLMAALGSGVGAAAMLCHLARLGWTAHSAQLLVWGDRLTLVAAILLAVATLVLTVGPELERRRHDAMLQDDLGPLWRLLSQRFPTVRLASTSRNFRMERTMIEIHDALALMRVGSSSQSAHPDDPLRVVAHAVLHPAPLDDPGSKRGSEVLPRVLTPHDDLKQLRSLAEALREESFVNSCLVSRPRVDNSAPRH